MRDTYKGPVCFNCDFNLQQLRNKHFVDNNNIKNIYPTVDFCYLAALILQELLTKGQKSDS